MSKSPVFYPPAIFSASGGWPRSIQFMEFTPCQRRNWPWDDAARKIAWCYYNCVIGYDPSAESTGRTEADALLTGPCLEGREHARRYQRMLDRLKAQPPLSEREERMLWNG